MKLSNATVAQLEERCPEEAGVGGPSPSGGTASAVLRFTLPASSGSRGSGQIGKAPPSHGGNCTFKSCLLHAFESVAAAANLPTESGRLALLSAWMARPVFCLGSSALGEQPPRKRQVASSSLAPGPVEMTGLTTTGFRAVVELATTPNCLFGWCGFESRRSCRAKRQDDDTRCQRAEKQLSQRHLYRSV